MAKAYAGPSEALARYESLVAGFPDVERRGTSTPYTSLNGHMFSFLDPSGALSLRLSPGDRREFLETYESTLSEQHGRVMKDFVLVPAALLGDVDELSPWLARSHQWTATLRPKPTTGR